MRTRSVAAPGIGAWLFGCGLFGRGLFRGFVLGSALLGSGLSGCDGPLTSIDAGSDAARPDARAELDAGPPPVVFPLSGTDPEASTEELAPLAPIIGDASVVGIGESVHTTGGEIEMRARLIRYLVRELGFRAIAIESSRTSAARLTQPYVESCAGTAEDAARGIYSIWWDVSTPPLLEWLCQWNQEHPSDPVSFFGFDIRQPWDDHPDLRAYLERVAPAEAASIADGLSSCLGVGYASEAAFFSDPTIRGYYSGTPMPDAEHDACTAGATAARDLLSTRRDAMIAASSEREYELARLAVEAMSALDASIYALSHGLLEQANPPRDAAMADAFLTLRRLDGAGRTIVFAHDGHVMIQSDRAIGGQWMSVRNMATLVHEQLAGDYVAVGQCSKTAYIDWLNGPPTVVAPDEASLEWELDRLGEPHLLVDVQAATRGTPPLIDPALHYRFGPGDTIDPALHYHALIFHRESRAIEYFTTPDFRM